jgi:small subunit ribosomal protein S6
VRRDYELGFILNPEVSEEQTRGLLERVEQIVATYGGQIVKTNQWGRRRLAYPIERHRDGFYVFMDLILEPETVSELERTLTVSEIVLRHMVKRRDPKAVQKEREEREEREARAAAAATAAAENANAEAAAPQEVPADQPEVTPALLAEVDPAEIADAPAAIEEEPAESVEA